MEKKLKVFSWATNGTRMILIFSIMFNVHYLFDKGIRGLTPLNSCVAKNPESGFDVLQVGGLGHHLSE